MQTDADRILEEMRRKVAAMSPEKKAQVKARVVPEALRAANVAHNIDSITAEADAFFDKGTSFDKKDWIFLAFCLGLQVVRQYFFTTFQERLSDKEAAKSVEGHIDEHSNRSHRLYHPSIEEIITNPVPFDAMMGSPKYNAYLSGTTHRYIPGHDPLLGYIVGTMNILTSTVTGFDCESFHVKTGFTKSNCARDCLAARADNAKILAYTKKRIIDEGSEGLQAFAAALCKEHIHLKTDLKTVESLPLPAMTMIDADLAKTLSNYGLDMLNVMTIGRQASISIIINLVISMLHRLMMPKGTDERLYMAKTKKIITYSNALATSGNILYVTLTKKWNSLDIGGSLVTIFNVVKTANFLTDLKIELRYENLRNHLNL